MSTLTVVILFVFLAFLAVQGVCLLWRYRKWYFAAQKFHGPLAVPLIGNAYALLISNDKILTRVHEICLKYINEPLRFWMGPVLLIGLPNPEHAEKILSSSKFVLKYEPVYRFPKVFLGEGLITGSGPDNKKHRRIIQPMVDLGFAKECTNVMQKHIATCMQKLLAHVDQGKFDIFHVIHPCMADVIKETILGTKENTQETGSTEFDRAMLDGYDFAFTRMVKVIYYSDFIFNLTPLKKRQDYLRNVIRTRGEEFVENAIKRQKEKLPSTDFPSISDKLAEYLDDHPGVFSKERFTDHLLTLYTASEDTLAVICSFVALVLGMYPECQQKAANEVREIFGDTPRPVTTDDIPKLKYITMCIKEVLRLFPIAPLIVRKCSGDFQLDQKWLIPKGCGIVIPIFTLQRDPRVWEKPNDFYPEHFLPEAEEKRHVYSYIPFSAGPRGCIGKILAHTGIKVFTCNLLQRFHVEAEGDVPTLKIRMDISTRPIHGHVLRLKKRVWT
ncbi:cytochrome P450 4V2-like [Anthonomus grandis grandis]|uniref:cytochrome P450 4V2-like n=1 Tax=Anthonomus grandis grandis TaxID=2921223 RepID=UPI00216567A3|nr:cytochrome P450 4V2-like [Anthonomus grandis grandis]